MNVFGMANIGECHCAIADMNSFGICLEIELPWNVYFQINLFEMDLFGIANIDERHCAVAVEMETWMCVYVCVRVCMCACVRARACACVYACEK